MSKIDQLIAELCPLGVSSLTLGEVCEVANNKRKPVKSSLRTSGDIPYYGANNIQDYVDGFTHDGEYVLIAEDGSASLTNYSIQFTTGKFWANNHVHVVKGLEKLENRFLYHFLSGMNFATHLTGGARAKLNKAKLVEIKMPIPPLEVQKEIVKILDTFTQLEAELSAELEARRTQYEYYRNQLLMPGDDARWASIGEVTVATSNIKWKEAGSKSYRYIDLSSVSREDKSIGETLEVNADSAPSRAQKLVNKDDIIFATTRPTLQRYAIIDDNFDGQIASTGYCVLRAKRSEVLPKWLYFNIAKTDFNNYMEKNQEGSAYPAISDSKVKAFNVPVPSLSEQARIVSILDKFDALVNDISSGLPAEITARRQQYEYYRTKLLTFQERTS